MAKKKLIKAAKKPPVKKKPAGKTKKPAKAKTPSLGRPTVSQEEKLFLLFREDFHARQIFEFLRAETVGDLEQFSPQEIIHRLSRPIRETVNRIRTKLAERNRCLAGDEQYAAEQKNSAESKPR